ncbi:serine/threonine-protein kinase [Thermosporothrix hazakensis]|uniref:non-specific serine/threonine protein kinase n=2 Tax=Thermosporothrix TaxID=768650 RepID=A0A326U4U6_THEHA|nr:serine/threonine-protein kinase [Thermosporothrix hazakensis]PZW26328.1 serine/threonine-protein kinase [Thermosporothrix hazakensis]BBH90670.1 hypothetical protein KTC_54210 [Thermosporothrix sp. COM3]GCE48721.1 hypothetical protein KTH_35900 [Thermosporothrix hazakensis]
MATDAQYLCTGCGTTNRPQARFCTVCGHPLALSHAVTPEERVLKGRYHVLAHLGSGGYGKVYQAEDREFGNRLVAIKELRCRAMSEKEKQETAEAFKQEAFLLAKLVHPNLPSIFDYFTEDGNWFLVMSFIEGLSLENYLRKMPGNRLSVAEVMHIGIQLCTVLDYLHSRPSPIIFRDLKPSNIMRTRQGQVYLIDFGIARIFKQGQTKDTVALGSPGFAAPEQYGKAQSTPQTDIYSLGATLHYLLSGQDPSYTPFSFEPLDLPEYLGINSLLLAMVDPDVRKRPLNVIAVKQGLERILKQCPPGLVLRERSRRVQPSTPVYIPPLQAARPEIPPPSMHPRRGEKRSPLAFLQRMR